MDYDYIWSVNHFYKHPKFQKFPVDLCFVGQEVTARMRHKTALKNGLVILQSATQVLELNSQITNENGKPVELAVPCTLVLQKDGKETPINDYEKPNPQ